MASISPRPEDVEAHARILLEEAGDYPHLVQTTMDGPTGLMFIVPDDLADRYLARIGQDSTEQFVQAGEAESGYEDVPADTPAPAKRRGRQPGSKNKPKIQTTDGAD